MQLRVVILIVSVLAIFPQVVSAAVNWSECRTEVYTDTLPVGTTAQNFDFQQPPVDNSKAFVLVSATGASIVRPGSEHMVSGQITSGNRLRITRESSAGDIEFSAQLIECFNNEIFVQRNIVTLNPGQDTVTDILTTSIDVSKSIVLVSARTDDSANAEYTALVTGELLSDTEVQIQRDSSAVSSTTNIRYVVVTFSDESGASVQTNSIELPSGAADISESLATEVDTERTWLYCSYDADDPAVRASAVGCELTDSTTATFYRYASGAYTNTIRYYAIEFPPNTVTITRGSYSDNPSGTDDTLYYENVTIDNIGDPQRAFVYQTNTTDNQLTGFPKNRWLAYLTSATSIYQEFWRPGSSSSDAFTKYYQVIRFPHYEATGFGWIGNTPDDTSSGGVGLISFNCDNFTGTYLGTLCSDGSGSSRYDYAVQLETGGCGAACDVTGQAWLGSACAGSGCVSATGDYYPIGIVDFDPAIDPGSLPTVVGDDPATVGEDESLDAHWNEETEELYGWARFQVLRDYEDNVVLGPNDDWGWIKLRGDVNDGVCTLYSGDCDEYGVLFDRDTSTFSGWSWNDNGTDASSIEVEGSGFGWIKFDLSETTTGTLTPWLRTVQGDVYVNDDVDITPAPGSQFNGTFLIESTGLVKDFTSEYATLDPEFAFRHYVDVIGFPEDNTTDVYRGDIGSVNVAELIRQATEDGNAYTGTNCDESIFGGSSVLLDNQTYYCEGDLTISSNISFVNGINLEIGSGTIVVGGDLILEDNITYADNNYNYFDHIANIASVGWVIEGSVEVNPTVNNLAGAFIVLGDAGVDPDFVTGVGSEQLNISGLVMARGFEFGRTHVGTSGNEEPAEDIVYDGRTLANPPKGLEDLSKILPSIQ